MILKYNDIVQKGKTFKVYNENHPEVKSGKIKQYEMHLYPWLITPSGEFWYDFCGANMTHSTLSITNDVNTYLLNMIGETTYCSLVKTQKASFKVSRPSPYNKFHHAQDITAADVRMTINNGCLKPWIDKHSITNKEKGYFNNDMKDLFNSIYNAKTNIDWFFYNFSQKCNNSLDAINKLFNVYNKKFIDFTEDDIMHYKPFVDEDYKSPEAQRGIHYANELNKLHYVDLLIQLLDFDIISSVLRKTIVTSKTNFYEYFYEYINNGYNIVQVPKLIFDENIQNFRFYDQGFINTGTNRECENKIEDLGLSYLIK